MSSAKSSLHSIYPRELLCAPRPTVALAGSPELHGFISDKFRATLSITGSSVTIKSPDGLFEAKEHATADPLASTPARVKGLLKADMFLRFQRQRPAVVLAFVERSRLTSGPSQWKQCMDELKALHALARTRNVRIVIAVLDATSPPVATMEEFQSIVLRDLAVEPGSVLHLKTPTPDDVQVEALRAAVLGQAQAAYKAWQSHLYRKMQFQSLQPDAYDAVVRAALKLAHVCELAHEWQAAKAKYSEAYLQLSYIMQLARGRLSPTLLCAVCSAADWTNMKVSLYCIGGGVANEATVQVVLAQWRLHRSTFCKPLEGAPPALQGWHHGWVARQYQAMLMTVNQYLSKAPYNPDALELSPYFLMEGCTLAALSRRDLAAALPPADSGDVILDVTRVEPSHWLGMYVLRGADGSTRELKNEELLVYLAYLERSVDHNSVIAGLLQSSIDACGLPIGMFSATSFKRRLLVLCARKARHSMEIMAALEAKDPKAAAAAALDARALLLQASVQFRKDGWLQLLADSLRYLRKCTDREDMRRVHVVVCLELASLPSSMPLADRQLLAQGALAELLESEGAATPRGEAAPPLDYVIQWGDMSGVLPDSLDIKGGIEDHGWLNVVHLSAGFCPAVTDPDDITLGVALKSHLPGGTALPLDAVSVVIAADKGYISLAACPLPDETATLDAASGRPDDEPAQALKLLPINDVKWHVVPPPMSEPAPPAPEIPAALAAALGGGAHSVASASSATALRDEALAALGQSPRSAAPTSLRTSVGDASEPGTPLSPWRPDMAMAAPVDVVLQGARWQVFGVRFRPAGATTVKVKSVTLHFRGGRRAVWHLATAYSINEPSTMPTLFSGAGTEGTLALTGPHAPFASSSISFVPGKLALLLHYDSPPPHVAVVPSDNFLVNDPGLVTVTVLPLASITGAKLVLSSPCRSPVSTSSIIKPPGEFIVIQTRIGESWEVSTPLRANDEIDLPPLWKGERLVVKLWLQIDTPCDMELSVAVAHGVSTLSEPVGARISVAEPFRFEAQFFAHDQASLLLMQPPRSAPWTESPNLNAAPFNVAAGSACVMSLVVTASAPCPLLLQSVDLVELLDGWELAGSTADSTLAAEPLLMRKGDVHSAFFYLVAPSLPQLTPLGALDLKWRRAPVAQEASPWDDAGGEGASFLSLLHPLPSVFVDDVMLSASLAHPPTVKKMCMFELILEISNHTQEVQSITARALGHPGVAVETETQSYLQVQPKETGYIFWHLRGMQLGQQPLPLVTIECSAFQATCRSMQRHILVEGV